mgnify:CR=1 FL=1
MALKRIESTRDSFYTEVTPDGQSWVTDTIPAWAKVNKTSLTLGSGMFAVTAIGGVFYVFIGPENYSKQSGTQVYKSNDPHPVTVFAPSSKSVLITRLA